MAGVAVMVGVLLSLASPVLAADAPHVPTEIETDACAMCHRSHVPASDATWTAPALSDEASGNALLAVSSIGVGDTEMCFTCHGVDALGSTYDIQTSFTSESSHTLAPYSSAYGPSLKQCSSCHDSHGSQRMLSGDPYPALLRSRSTTNPAVVYYGGVESCVACHPNRVADVWDGLDVWNSNTHSSKIDPPASGTGIVCSACHEPHGSNNPPNVRETLYPPAVATTTTIAANDRTLCYACHTNAQATYRGKAVYETSGFGVSETTITAVGEWASAQDTRLVGECQNCHSPMGSSDGFGGTVPKLAEKAGRDLCDTCHSPSSETSQTAVDMAQFKFPPSEIPKAEVAVAYDAERLGAVFDRIALYAQETTGTLPFDLIGPREYDIPGRSSDMSYGDVQGDGVPELVIADPTAHRLVFAAANQLSGVATSVPSPNVDATPTLVAVGDIFVDSTARPEIAIIQRDTVAPYASSLRIYRYQAGGLVSLVSTTTGNDATGLVLGNLGGTAGTDIVVTSAGDDSLRIYTESGVATGTLSAPTVVATGIDPRGPSIGDADSATAGNEIALALSGATSGNLRVYSSAGGVVGSYNATVAPGAWAWDTLITDVLPGTAGQETVVALRNTAGNSGVNVFSDAAGAGLGTTPLSYVTGLNYASSSLAAGDVDSDADGDAELVVANAGKWASTGTTCTPSVQVFRSNAAGTALSAPVTHSAGGVEMAGNTPAVIVGDLRAVGRTRHPTSVVSGAHVSTETAPFVRHVECTDCHNVHEATSTVAAAPLVYGRLKGAWGVGFDNYTYAFRQGVINEYEVCFKCHSDYDTTQVATGSSKDVRSQLDTRTASFHPVMGASTTASNTAGSFVAGWTKTSRTYCKDCHGNSVATEPAGLHASNAAPLLSKPVWGTSPGDANMLCYTCHKRTVYYTGADDYPAASMSMFYDLDLVGEKRLHYRHVNLAGMRCDACHAGHGSSDYHLIEPGLDWVHEPNGGACYTTCHSGSTANIYSRVSTAVTATSITRNAGTAVAGKDKVKDTETIDAKYYELLEAAGGYPVMQVDIDFTTLTGLPAALKIYGRYQGTSVGHTVRVYAWNYVTGAWVNTGELPHVPTATDSTYNYAVPSPQANYVSGGAARIRIDHLNGGVNTHKLWLDRVWLEY